MICLLTPDGMDFLGWGGELYLIDLVNAQNQCFIFNDILLSDGFLGGRKAILA